MNGDERVTWFGRTIELSPAVRGQLSGDAGDGFEL